MAQRRDDRDDEGKAILALVGDQDSEMLGLRITFRRCTVTMSPLPRPSAGDVSGSDTWPVR
jgi:hypothetical protein